VAGSVLISFGVVSLK